MYEQLRTKEVDEGSETIPLDEESIFKRTVKLNSYLSKHISKNQIIVE